MLFPIMKSFRENMYRIIIQLFYFMSVNQCCDHHGSKVVRITTQWMINQGVFLSLVKLKKTCFQVLVYQFALCALHYKLYIIFTIFSFIQIIFGGSLKSSVHPFCSISIIIEIDKYEFSKEDMTNVILSLKMTENREGFVQISFHCSYCLSFPIYFEKSIYRILPLGKTKCPSIIN